MRLRHQPPGEAANLRRGRSLAIALREMQQRSVFVSPVYAVCCFCHLAYGLVVLLKWYVQ